MLVTIEELKEEARAKINEETHGSYVRGFDDGAKAVLKEIEKAININYPNKGVYNEVGMVKHVVAIIKGLKGIE